MVLFASQQKYFFESLKLQAAMRQLLSTNPYTSYNSIRVIKTSLPRSGIKSGKLDVQSVGRSVCIIEISQYRRSINFLRNWSIVDFSKKIQLFHHVAILKFCRGKSFGATTFGKPIDFQFGEENKGPILQSHANL